MLKKNDLEGYLNPHDWLVIPDLHGSRHFPAAAAFMSGMVSPIIQLGDVIDVRDEDCSSIVAIKALMQLKEACPQLICLRGNHEQMLLDHLARSKDFECAVESEFAQDYSALSEFSKEYHGIPDDIMTFIKASKLYHQTQNLLFVHAGCRWNKQASDVTELDQEDLLWAYEVSRNWRGKKLVRGHRIVGLPEEYSNHINCETGGWKGNKPLIVSIVRDTRHKQKLRGWIEFFDDEIKLVTGSTIDVNY